MEKSPVKKVGIVVKPNSPEALSTAHELSDWLGKNGVEQAGDVLDDLDRQNGSG